MTKTLCEIITKYEDNASLETIRRSFKHMDEFLHEHKHVIKEEDYHKLMEKMEDIFCPYLTEEKAMYYTSKIVNSDGTKGPHFTVEQVSNTLAAKHIDKETKMYSFYDIYTQINLVYSDLGAILNYDTEKIISASLAYLNDMDFPGKGMISYTKWYCEAKEELSEEVEDVE